MNPAVAVVIVTYNGQEVIEKCLSTLIESSDLLSNIIVVDNQSTDNTLSILEKFKDHIQLIQLDSNLGFGQANNKGITEALQQGADYLLLLNQDVYFDRDNLSLFIKESTESIDHKIGIYSPIHVDGSANKLDYNFKTFLFKNKPSDLVDTYLLNNPKTKKSYEANFVNAAIWLLPKKTLAIVGGFDPIFFHYGEDRNYVNRLHYHNLSVHIIPECYAIHDRGQQDGTYKKENLARFLFLVEATDLNTRYSLLSLLLRVAYRNYITRTGGIWSVITKSMSDSVKSFSKLSEARKTRKTYPNSTEYRYINIPK